MVVTIPHVQSFETLVDTLIASNVSAFHPYINFCSAPCLLVAALKGSPSRHHTHSSRHNFLPLTHIPLFCVSVLEVVMFQHASLPEYCLLFLLHMLGQCPVHPNLLGFTVQSVQGDLYKPRRSWLSNVVNRPVGILLLLNIATLLCSTCSCTWYCSSFWGRKGNKGRVCCLEIACVTISRCYFYAE